MADLAEKKKERGSQKRKVNKGIQRFRSLLVYCSDFGELKEKAHALESNFDSLADVHEECMDFGSEDEDYMEEITSSFEEVMKSFYSMAKAEKEKLL